MATLRNSTLVPPRVKAVPIASLLMRIRAEYREQPGLHLTTEQAQRLWLLGPVTCEALLGTLVAEHFLRRTPTGYVRADSGG